MNICRCYSQAEYLALRNREPLPSSPHLKGRDNKKQRSPLLKAWPPISRRLFGVLVEGVGELLFDLFHEVDPYGERGLGT